jgi:hypothetical protein
MLWHIHPVLLLNKYMAPLLNNRFRNKHVSTAINGYNNEEQCYLCSPCQGIISRTSLTEYKISSWDSWVENSQLVESCCSWNTGTVRVHRGKGMSAVGSIYQETGEYCDSRHVCVTMISKMQLQIISKNPVNPVANPNPTFSHTQYMWQYIYIYMHMHYHFGIVLFPSYKQHIMQYTVVYCRRR